MKCYYTQGDRVEQISLGRALTLIQREYDGVRLLRCADMLQLSSAGSPVDLGDSGTVHCEDDVPVLDFDPVLKDWWALKVAELPAAYHHVLLSLIKWSDGSSEVRVAGNTCDANGDFIELYATQCEPIIAQLKEIKHVSAKPTDTQPQDAGTDEPGSEGWKGWADYPPF
jgi:hypothetical protein